MEGRWRDRAFVALGALCGPAAIMAFWVAGVWDRMQDFPWRMALQHAMAPIVVCLAFSGGFVLATPGNTPDWRLWLIAAVSAIGLLTSRVNPLWLLAAGGVLGELLL